MSTPPGNAPAQPSPAGATPNEGHLDLVLQHISSLPTLSPIAVKVMRLSDSGDADLRDFARAIESDPSLSAKVLALCRRADLGVSARITTVERAVVMLGLEPVRAALLSVEVHGAFTQAMEKSESAEPGTGFDRHELWRHSLAVACAAELLAQANGAALQPFTASEAFLAGLLHDLGKVALDAVLPKSYSKAAELASTRQMSIAEAERRVLGLDHHAAGKRLAEHWGLPHALQDVMWLHGQAARTLPDVPHRPLISVVTLADAMARAQHLGWSGNAAPTGDLEGLAHDQGLVLPKGAWQAMLHERTAQRATDLGLSRETMAEEMLRCIARANARLGRTMALVEERARTSGLAAQALQQVTMFHEEAAGKPGFLGAVEAVGRSARRTVGGGVAVLVVQVRDGAAWSLHRFDGDGRIDAQTTVAPPAEQAKLSELAEATGLGTRSAQAITWLMDKVRGIAPCGEIEIIPLAGAGLGLSAVLVHDRKKPERGLTSAGLAALAATWGTALASAARHEGARRLGEQLAESNRRLIDVQAKLVEHESMARLGELAAGAAHEMNNPLTVISGKSQLLAQGLSGSSKQAAQTIVESAQRLSDLIESLHLFASPPKLARHKTDIAQLLQSCAQSAAQRAGAGGGAASANIAVTSEQTLVPAFVDAALIGQAVTEVILNAIESVPRLQVQVRAHIDPFDDRLILTVQDDGVGMNPHTLKHACDPFFSDRPAGRQPGLGLTRAKRYVELHGGDLVLESEPGSGTCVRIVLPDWKHPASEEASASAAA